VVVPVSSKRRFQVVLYDGASVAESLFAHRSTCAAVQGCMTLILGAWSDYQAETYKPPVTGRRIRRAPADREQVVCLPLLRTSQEEVLFSLAALLGLTVVQAASPAGSVESALRLARQGLGSCLVVSNWPAAPQWLVDGKPQTSLLSGLRAGRRLWTAAGWFRRHGVRASDWPAVLEVRDSTRCTLAVAKNRVRAGEGGDGRYAARHTPRPKISRHAPDPRRLRLFLADYLAVDWLEPRQWRRVEEMMA